MVHAIVSGGTTGIGRATVLHLLAEGHKVSTFGHDSRDVDSVRAEAGPTAGRLHAVVVDLAVSVEVQRFAGAAVERFGPPRSLVNNAAVRMLHGFLDTTEQVWDHTFAVNVRGAFVLSRCVAGYMVEGGGGAIVNVLSGSAYGRPDLLAYCASKGALLTLTKAMAIDLAPHRVRVNGVVPGPTRSAMIAALDHDERRRFEERAAGASVAGRPNDPEDVAGAIAWLLSDAACTTSGAVLEVGLLPRYVK